MKVRSAKRSKPGPVPVSKHKIARKRAAIEAQTVALRDDLDLAEAELEMLQGDHAGWKEGRHQRAGMRSDARKRVRSES